MAGDKSDAHIVLMVRYIDRGATCEVEAWTAWSKPRWCEPPPLQGLPDLTLQADRAAHALMGTQAGEDQLLRSPYGVGYRYTHAAATGQPRLI